MKLTEQLRSIKIDETKSFDLNKYRRSSISCIMNKLKEEEGIKLTSTKEKRKLFITRLK